MKRDTFADRVLILSIILIGIRVFLVLVMRNSALPSAPPIIESTSPNNQYAVRIYGEKGEGLLNIPVYITVYGDTVESDTQSGKLCRISTQIDNDSGGAGAKSNVWLFWESDSEAIVILMGREQKPEIIMISFAAKTEVTRIRSTEMAKEILEKFQVDVETIPSYFW